MSSITKLSTVLVSLILATQFTAAQEQRFVGGWAARTPGNCAAGEADCGSRLPPFRACCPQGQYCRSPLSIQGFEDNTACCETEEDCSQQLLTYNVCADDEWGLYNNTGFPFCCQQGYRGGIHTERGYDSCRPLNQPFPSGEVALPQDTPDSRVIAVSTTSSSLPSSTSTGSSTGTGGSTTGTNSNASASSSSDSNSGGLATAAIAGIVVGCVALLALIALGVWLFQRKKHSKTYEEKGEQLRELDHDGTQKSSNPSGPHQLYSDHGSELMGQPIYPSQTHQYAYPNQNPPMYSGQTHKVHPAAVAELSG